MGEGGRERSGKGKEREDEGTGEEKWKGRGGEIGRREGEKERAGRRERDGESLVPCK